MSESPYDRKLAVLNLAANYGKASLPDRQIATLIDRLAPWGDGAVRTALRCLMDNIEQRYFPTWAESPATYRAYLVPAAASRFGGRKAIGAATGASSGKTACFARLV